MKVIELEHAHPTVDELIRLAKRELVVLRRPDGSVFAGAHPTNGFTYFAVDAAHPDRHLMVTCGYVGAPTNQIDCYAEVSPALG